MMNKKLSPLEALNNLRYGGLVEDDVVCFNKEALEKRLDIIETTLRQEEEDKKLLNEQAKSNRYLMEQIKQSNKKIKALKIIVDKQVDIRIFTSSAILSEHETPDAYNFTICDVERYLTQEEFDLLKEILL